MGSRVGVEEGVAGWRGALRGGKGGSGGGAAAVCGRGSCGGREWGLLVGVLVG